MLTLLDLFTFRFKEFRHSWTSEVNDINTKQREGGELVSSVFFFLLLDMNYLV